MEDMESRLLAALDSYEQARAEWGASLEAYTAAAQQAKKLGDDLQVANDVYGAQLCADGKNNVGPLAGLAATSKAFDLTLKANVATAPHLADLREAVEVAQQKRERLAADVEVCSMRLRSIELAIKAMTAIFKALEV